MTDTPGQHPKHRRVLQHTLDVRGGAAHAAGPPTPSSAAAVSCSVLPEVWLQPEPHYAFRGPWAHGLSRILQKILKITFYDYAGIKTAI